MLETKTQKDVLKAVKEHKISFIQFWFTDVLGMQKIFSITPDELEDGLREGMGFDGSSIQGFCRIEESDMIAMPDPTTFRLIPWRPTDRPVARMFCDIQNPDGTPYEGDPRYALKRILKKVDDLGYRFLVGPELEYFYFVDDTVPEPLDRGGYFDGLPIDRATDLRRQTIFALQEMGIRVEYSHHEVAPSQHEIDLRYAPALDMADVVMLVRYLVKRVARSHGLYATFMPKPINGQNGSGMHVHQSLWKGGKNAFFDGRDAYSLSDAAHAYTAGLLAHARETSAIFSQWVVSYKRLILGYEAPVYVAWGQRNRSAYIRVPRYQPGKEKATRIELRSPDPGCNVYLALAVMLAAGLDGIRHKLALADPVEENIYEMSAAQQKRLRIGNLPRDLEEAVKIMEKSALVRETLGEHIFAKFIANKRHEIADYRKNVGAEFDKQVSPYEVERYLPFL